MSLVATLICNPASPSLDSTIVDGARAVLPHASPAHWLFDGVAVDIPFGRQDNLEADRHDSEFWLRIPPGERVLLAWRLSVEQWQLAGHSPDEPRLCRSFARVTRR